MENVNFLVKPQAQMLLPSAKMAIQTAKKAKKLISVI